jgi:hypothetical protein
MPSATPSPRRRPLLRRLAALVLWALPALALAGPFTGNGTQPLPAHPVLASGPCAACHGDFDPARDVEPWPTWAGSMMAQSARDPLFWAALDVANHDVPGIGEWCLRCHAPAGWLAGRSEPPGGSVDGCALAGRLDERDNDFDGIGCHVCHRLMVNPSPPPGQLGFYLENGQVWLDDGDCGGAGEPCRRGPYDHPADGAAPPPHAWAYSPYHESSELCGACHNVTNPARNLIVGGVDAGIRFPIERTYREWALSDFGIVGAGFASCQDCHMPSPAGGPLHACSFALNDHTGDLPVHDFVGGNAWIPEVLRREYPALGLDASLARTRDLALDLLQNRSAGVDVSMPARVAEGETLAVDVTVTNLTGHKLPTGYPEGRRMWLHVEARDGAGALVFESGAYDPATGVLAADPQRTVYEAKQGVWNAGTATCQTEDAGGAERFHFALNDCVAKDNRIPPRGFFGASDVQTRPVGHLYPEVVPGSGILAHWDTTTYAIPVPPGTPSPVTVTATLRYQTTSKAYVEFLRDQAVTHEFPDDCLERTTGFPGRSRGELLHALWETYDRAPPVAMGSAAGSAEVWPPLDAFLCRRARGPWAGPLAPLDLDDVFGGGTFAATRRRALCAPAAVNGDGVLDATTAALGYRLVPAPASPPHVRQTGLAVRDRFGTWSVDTLAPDGLLVPTAVDLASPPAPPDPQAHEVDRFTCYRARPTRGTSRLPRGVQATVGDPFTAPARVVDVRRLRRLCVPEGGPGVAKHPAARVLCYAVRRAAGEPAFASLVGVRVANALEPAATVAATAAETLCVPAVAVP